MSILNTIKSALSGTARREPPRASNMLIEPPPLTAALDAAVDALDPAQREELKAFTDPRQNADLIPEGNPRPSLWRRLKADKLSEEEIEAERRREAIRADAARMRQENRDREEKARKEAQEAQAQKAEAEARRAGSWEARYVRYHRTDGEDIVITRPLLASLIRLGGLRDFVAARAAKARPHLEAWDLAFEARSKFTRAEFKRQLVEDLRENEQRLREGSPDLRTLPMADDYETQARLNRDTCKARQKEVANEVNPLLLEIADALRDAARKLAVEQEKRERNEAFGFGVEFEPSCVLRSLVAAGFNIRGCVERNWLASGAMCPRTTLFGILDPATSWE